MSKHIDTIDLYSNIKKRGYIEEAELKLINRRINDKRISPANLLILENGEVKLSPAQRSKGVEWLLRQGWTPKGNQRVNSPFGHREFDAIKTCKAIYLIDFIQHNQAFYFYPVYRVEGSDGAKFEYYLALGKIHIIG